MIGTEFRRQADRHVDDLCFDDDEVADDADDAGDGGGDVCGVGPVSYTHLTLPTILRV